MVAAVENSLARAVAWAPAKVGTKLLVAFLAIAALLVLIVVLGLRVLGQSNARVERLGELQQRASTYQTLLTQANQLRQLLALRAGGEPGFVTLTGARRSIPGGRRWILVDKTIAFALSEISPSMNEATYAFEPPPQDERTLKRIRVDFRTFAHTLSTVSALDTKGASGDATRRSLQGAINADQDLFKRANDLASRTTAQTSALIAENRSAYTSSRDLFIAVGAGSILLALALRLILSWSLISPIQRTEARLAEIAAGDFSGVVDVPNRDEIGSLAANVNRMNDELRRLYEELETTSRHKSEFLANMSHELRTPLNAIIGFSEVLHEQMVGDLNDQQLDYVHDVLEAGRYLLALINDILDLSKVEAGRMELELAEVSLPEALKSGLTMHEERANQAGIRLGLAFDPEEIVVRADERRLRQIVFNLVSNAVKFTPSGGRVDVSAQMTDGVVEVSVADTGPGIALDDQELIFEEFQQARHAGAGQRPEGTGLGLPLARRFIELHGGRLWVESAPGEGSTFRFTLPASLGA